MRLLALLFFICFINAAYAQNPEPWSGFGIEANAMTGKVFKHTKKFRAEVPDHSSAFEVNFVQQTWGKKTWHQRRNFPLAGFAFAYTNYGLDSIYGKSISMYPTLQLPILRWKNLEWTFKAGFGLCYATKRFERVPDWDTLNTAIGSHFNNYTYFATDIRYHLDKHWDLQLGGNFSHMSNAAFRLPNLGINMYGAHIGVRYSPVNSKPKPIVKDNLPKLKNRWLVQGRIGMAATEAGAPDGPLYPIYIVSAYASRRYHSKNKMYAGIDYSYNSSIYAFLRNNEIDVGKERSKSWNSAVFVGNEFLFGRVGIMLQVGVYIKEAALKLDPYYQKLGGNVYIVQKEKGALKELYTSVLLKTHKAQAELVEMGIGFGF